jgi:hypothetical protein
LQVTGCYVILIIPEQLSVGQNFKVLSLKI